MKNIRHYIQELKDLYSKGAPSNASRLSNKSAYRALLSSRAILLERKRNKAQKLENSTMQTIKCIDLVLEDGNCGDDCKLLVSKCIIPDTIASLSSDGIDSVMNRNGSITFDKTTEKTDKYSKGNKYTKNNYQYYISDKKIKVKNTKAPRVVSLTGLFYDPIEAALACSKGDKLDCCGNEITCKSYLDFEFPIDSGLEYEMKEMAFNSLVSKYLQIHQDRRNDSIDRKEA